MEMGWIAAGLSFAAIAGVLALARRFTASRGIDAPDPSEAVDDRLWHSTESEERYRALVEATTDIIVQRDAHGRITFANEGFAALLGHTPLALIGAKTDLEVLERAAAERLPNGVARVEERVRGADGRVRWFSVIEIPVQGANGLQRLRAGCDITGRREAARSLDEALTRAEAANVAKSRFLATVSHEFRTPLNGILGMADLVMETNLDAEQRTYLDAIRTSGSALLTLIDGILDFSRIEAGKLELAAAPFDIAALAESVVELLAPRAQDKGLEIALDVAEDLAGLHLGDADRVRQILLNLAGNAVKFTLDGGVGLALAEDGDAVTITVADTGPGIPEDRIPQLFEEFEQGDAGAGSHGEGTGLGLAITRRLVTQMNGRIETTSVLGRGTTFRVILPLPRVETIPAPRVALDGRSVLVVAESVFQAPYLARCLTRAGARTVIAADAESGLAALAGARFDAMIADRRLGDDALRTLAVEAKRCGVRCSLVLLSPFDRREVGGSGASGFDSYLIKPVRARSLFDRLLEPRWVWREGEGEGESEGPPPAAMTPVPAWPGACRVLLAEDNPINALLATKALERLGATVVLARDGHEAIRAIQDLGHDASRFDLALIDIRMPGLDGLETARRIRARETETGLPPLHLVALTANAGRDDEQAARAAGFDGFLAKPLDLKALPGLLAPRAAAA